MFEHSAKDFNVQTSHLTSYDDDINFVDTNGAILIRSAVGKYDQHRQEARAILKESLRSMKDLNNEDEIDTKTMSSVLEDEKQEDETSSEDVDHLEGEPYFFPISTDRSDIRKRALDTVDTVMSDAVQRCLAMYAYDGAQNSAKVTAALAQLQNALHSLESALPDSALSHNFLVRFPFLSSNTFLLTPHPVHRQDAFTTQDIRQMRTYVHYILHRPSSVRNQKMRHRRRN